MGSAEPDIGDLESTIQSCSPSNRTASNLEMDLKQPNAGDLEAAWSATNDSRSLKRSLAASGTICNKI